MKQPLLHFAERGSGSPVLLVHGLMISGEMFRPVLDQFATRRRVIVPDLRGHGRSRGLPPPYDASTLANDLASLLDHLGIWSTVVLGYSQGGAVAQQFALDYPDRCSRLVLACTYAFNMASLREQLEGRLVPVLVRLLGMKRFARSVIGLGMKRVEKTRAAWVAGLIGDQDATLMVKAWRAAMEFDSRSRLADISCPTLVIAGSDDHAVPMHHARMLHEGIAGSALSIVDGADHALIWERPDEFVRVVENFLTGSLG